MSWLSNASAAASAWSAGRHATCSSTPAQRTESGQVARIDLVPRTPRFREDQFRDLFDAAGAPRHARARRRSRPRRPARRPPPDARRTTRRAATARARRPSARTPRRDRLRRHPPRASHAARRRRRAARVDQPRRQGAAAHRHARRARRTCTSTPWTSWPASPPWRGSSPSTAGVKSDAQWSPDGREVYYLEGGRISVVTVETRTVRPVAVTAEMDVDFAREKMAVFQPGVDATCATTSSTPVSTAWTGRGPRARYGPRVAGARTPDEMRRVHVADDRRAERVAPRHRRPAGRQQPTTGRLGLRFDRGRVRARRPAARSREVLAARARPRWPAGARRATAASRSTARAIDAAHEPGRAAASPHRQAATTLTVAASPRRRRDA